MKGKPMYLYMMLIDIVINAALEIVLEMGLGKEEVTKEMWLEMSAASRERRKDIMAKIRAH